MIVISKQLSARPFVSLTQDAKIAEKDKNRVKNKGNLLPQRHSTAEDAEIAEEGMFFVYKQTIILLWRIKERISLAIFASLREAKLFISPVRFTHSSRKDRRENQQ